MATLNRTKGKSLGYGAGVALKGVAAEGSQA